MRHAYYLAHTDSVVGDKEYGQGLRILYLSYCSGFTDCTRFCGASRYDTPEGVKTIVVVKNFFNPKPEAFYTHLVSLEKP